MLSAVPDQAERLGEDDLATNASELFLAGALQNQRHAAALSPSARRGVCTNCGEQCLPLAVYCDQACREDHETRVELEQRRGRR